MKTTPVLAALAVLGTSDRETLAYLLDRPLYEEEISALTSDPSLTADGELLRMQPAAAELLLKALEQEDFLHFRHLHERAIAFLGEELQKGRAEVESTFAALFIRLAEWLITQAPQQLLALVEEVGRLPLAPRTRAYQRLFTGIALRHLERYAEALACFDALLAEPTLDPDVCGRVLNARGVAYFWQGQLQQALDDYAASLAVWQQTGDQVQAGLVHLHLGIAAYELHDYPQSEAHLDAAEALFVATNTATWLPSVWNERGLIRRDQGRWQDALDCFERSLAQRRAEGATHRIGVILNNVGEVLLLQGKLTEARQALEESLEKMTVDHVRIDAWVNLGLIHQLVDEWTLADVAYTQALTLAQTIKRHDILPTLYYRLADLATRAQQRSVALHYLRQGIEQIEATRNPLREEAVKISLLGRWQQLYEAAVLLLVEQQEYAEALTLVERARARAFFEMAGTTTLPAQEPLRAQRIRQQLPAEMLLIEFFATGLPGSLASLLAQLPPAAAGLRPLLLPPERLLLFCVGAGTIACYDLPIRLSQIEAHYFQRTDGRLRGVLPLAGQSLRPLRRWDELGGALFTSLQPHLPQKRHLLFVPHALLHYVPLHALCDWPTLTHVATSVSYAPSASIFFAKLEQGRQTTIDQPGRRLAIGVDRDGLNHAEAEARWVAQQLAGEPLIGAQATPAALLQALPGADLIHISCHGRFRQRLPLQSALLVYDGEISAADLLASVRLRARLVTLSACDTGLNLLAPGDEPLGLTRAVLGCGAHALLATLWPVHEIPTRLLMAHFYTQWLLGNSKADALAAAQRWLADLTCTELQQQLSDWGLAAEVCAQTLALFAQMLPGNHPFDHPTYWAPFVLIGDPS